jgi:hypothetical protein
MVICNAGFTTFDLILDTMAGSKRVFPCPCCDNAIRPVTAAFNNCEWKFKGVKINQGTPMEVKNDWQRAGNCYEFFKPDAANQVAWARLLITARQVPEEGSGLQQCAICQGGSLLSPSDQQGITTPCGHRFHRECLKPWLLLAGTCPNCRRDISSLEPAAGPVRTRDALRWLGLKA